MQEYSVQTHGLGTTLALTVIAPPSARVTFDVVAAQVFAHFAAVEQRFSRFRADSELCRLNAAAGRFQPVSLEMQTVLGRALAAAHATNGVFDPTILGCLQAAGYATDFEKMNKEQVAITMHAAAGRFADVQIRAADGAVFLPAGVALDLGGSAKGYAVDGAAAIVAAHFDRFFVNAGGDLRLVGLNLENQAWRIGVENPHDTGAVLLALAATDVAVATSGSYRRRWRADAEIRHHIIDPRSGRSSTSDVASATIFARTAEQADTLATTSFVLGCQAALGLARQHAVDCLLIDTQGFLHTTSGISAYLTSQYD